MWLELVLPRLNSQQSNFMCVSISYSWTGESTSWQVTSHINHLIQSWWDCFLSYMRLTQLISCWDTDEESTLWKGARWESHCKWIAFYCSLFYFSNASPIPGFSQSPSWCFLPTQNHRKWKVFIKDTLTKDMHYQAKMPQWKPDQKLLSARWIQAPRRPEKQEWSSNDPRERWCCIDQCRIPVHRRNHFPGNRRRHRTGWCLQHSWPCTCRTGWWWIHCRYRDR